jgi:hypothetical protein
MPDFQQIRLFKQINVIMLDDLYNVSIAAFMYKVFHEQIVSCHLFSKLSDRYCDTSVKRRLILSIELGN